jgi:CheY-like chemotaxis protein
MASCVLRIRKVSSRLPPARSWKGQTLPLKSPLVLCVDDDAAIRDFYGCLLGREGYEVMFAGTGVQALALVQSAKDPVDAAILDYKLPGMNGFELAMRLKEHDPGLPILMISGSPPELEDMLPFVDAAMSKGVPALHILEGVELLVASRRGCRRMA